MRARTLLRLLLLAELGGALLVAWLLAARASWPGWLALAAGLSLAVLVRLAISLNNFAMAARAGSPVPDALRLDAAGRLRLLAGEFGASMLAAHWHMLGAPGRLRLHGAHTPARMPVLLVHGYGASGGYWAQLVRQLDAANISHLAIDLVPVACAIDDYAPQIERAVAELCAATGAPRVAIVAHSMGGLAARAWMRAAGTTRLARLVTLGSPHHGTALARLGLGANAAQMRRGSAWLRALADSENAAARALITTIYTHHDNIVAPQDSSRLEDARNLALGGIGHVALGSHPRVLAAVLRELDHLSTSTNGTTP